MAKNAKKKVVYSEPAEYIPKSIRKELKIGEYAEKDKKTETKKKVKRK